MSLCFILCRCQPQHNLKQRNSAKLSRTTDFYTEPEIDVDAAEASAVTDFGCTHSPYLSP